MADPSPSRIRVLISSTKTDLVEYREAASQVLEGMARRYRDRFAIDRRWMEDEPQSGLEESTAGFSARMAEEYEWVVLIVAFKYGTRVSPSFADGQSISHTELEFRRASQSGKKRIFVFMAGDPVEDGDSRYRRETGEDIDLKDWRGQGSEVDLASLKRFRDELRRTRMFALFKNLEDFTKKLEDALDQAIQKRQVEVAIGIPLTLLIRKVGRAIKSFGRKVRAIEKCKEVHDCLHTLRQEVIRRLQEGVMPTWYRDGELGEAEELALVKRLTRYHKLIGQLEIRRSGIQRLAGNEELLFSIDRVLQNQQLLQEDPDQELTSDERGPKGYERFAECTSVLSEMVERAFDEANSRMKLEEEDLRKVHQDLEINIAAERQTLDAHGEAQLDSRLIELRQMLENMRAVLASHDEWQSMHIRVRELDSLLPAFSDDTAVAHLKRFCLGSQNKLFGMITRRLERGFAQPAAVTISGWNRPETERGLLEDLARTFATLDEKPSKESFKAMRKYFDDTFFEIDKLTLSTVQTVSAHVQDIERLVDQIDQGSLSKPNTEGA